MSRFDDMKHQMQQNPQLQAAQQWYSALPQRDQMIVKGVGLFVALALVFVILYAPLMKENSRLQQRVQKATQTYNLIAENAYKFGSVSSSSNSGGRPVLAVATQEARGQGVTLSRYEQDGNGLRIWLDKIPFDDAVAWLETLNHKHGIRVSQITVDQQSGRGWVNVRATLTP